MSLTLNRIAPSVSERLILTIQGICRAVAAHGGRDRSNTALIVLVWGRLSRTIRRFEALITLARAGRLPDKPLAVSRIRPSRPPEPNHPRLPGGFAWLLRLVPETAGYGSQLQYLLEDPEMTALLKAAPQAGRILRPLCRMLGVKPGPALRSPPRQTTLDRPAPPPPQANPIETGYPAKQPPDDPIVPDRFANPSDPNGPIYLGFSPPSRMSN